MFNIWFAQPLEEVMENIGEFIPKATEIQSGGRERSPELIAEDERLVENLRERHLVGKAPTNVKT